jgi:hypothetical protein
LAGQRDLQQTRLIYITERKISIVCEILRDFSLSISYRFGVTTSMYIATACDFENIEIILGRKSLRWLWFFNSDNVYRSKKLITDKAGVIDGFLG